MLDGKHRPASQCRDSYTHAQKMRAAMTYTFGRTLGLGSRPWQVNEMTGRMAGNPSVSETVSSYMMSLRNRKVSRTHSCVFIATCLPFRFVLVKQQ